MARNGAAENNRSRTDTEIAGYPVVKLWMQCNENDDMDIHVQLRKKDKNGKCTCWPSSLGYSPAGLQRECFNSATVLHHLNFPSLDGIEEGDDQDVNIFKFLGS